MVKWACCHFSETENICDLKPLSCSLASTHIGGKGYLSGFPLPSWSQVSVFPPPIPFISSFPAIMIQRTLACLIRAKQRKTKMKALAFFFFLPSTSPQFLFSPVMPPPPPGCESRFSSPPSHLSWLRVGDRANCSHNNIILTGATCHDAHLSLPPCLGRTG